MSEITNTAAKPTSEYAPDFLRALDNPETLTLQTHERFSSTNWGDVGKRAIADAVREGLACAALRKERDDILEVLREARDELLDYIVDRQKDFSVTVDQLAARDPVIARIDAALKKAGVP